MKKETNKKKSINAFISISLYILSALLVISYFVILALSIKPKVSWEYELYYISKETDVWPGENGYDYYIGTKINTTIENVDGSKRLGKGFAEYEELGCWSSGDVSKIYFKNIPKNDLIFEMALSKCLLSKNIELYFNDIYIDTISAEELSKTMKIMGEVKTDFINDERLVVTLKYPELNNGKKDNRLHGIMCKEINLYEK